MDITEQSHDKTNTITFALSEDSDQPGHPPQSLMCAQWVPQDPLLLHADSEDFDQNGDAQADLSLRWAQMSSCWFCRAAAHISDPTEWLRLRV